MLKHLTRTMGSTLAAALVVCAAANAVPSTKTVKRPPTAASLIKGACAKSASTGKTVWVIFGASWCGVCHILDGYLASPTVKPIIDRYYIVVNIDIDENGPATKLENPYGNYIAYQMAGCDPNLPYYAFIDPHGRKIADSQLVVGNPSSDMGFPTGTQQLAWFRGTLHKTAPRMTAKQLDQLVACADAYFQPFRR